MSEYWCWLLLLPILRLSYKRLMQSSGASLVPRHSFPVFNCMGGKESLVHNVCACANKIITLIITKLSLWQKLVFSLFLHIFLSLWRWQEAPRRKTYSFHQGPLQVLNKPAEPLSHTSKAIVLFTMCRDSQQLLREVLFLASSGLTVEPWHNPS
jgi:hypothetical protein